MGGHHPRRVYTMPEIVCSHWSNVLDRTSNSSRNLQELLKLERVVLPLTLFLIDIVSAGKQLTNLSSSDVNPVR